MQSVGTLAGGVAHEFNNLLAGINGYASLGLREPNLPATLREFLQHVVDLSERAAGLTRQLLAFARKPALLRQPTAMGKLLRTTADLVARTMFQDVVVDIPQGAEEVGPLVVEADANQLQQALVNLALNARDAILDRQGRQGAEVPSPAIEFRLRHAVLEAELPGFPQHVPPGDYVLLEVMDQGLGMASEVLNQALDPFFTTKEVGQGTGLGLPMVFGIVQGHQGFLVMDSQPGQGTHIGMYLPRLSQVGRPDKGQPTYWDSEVVEPESTPGCAILVIDDEEAVLDVVRRFLQIAGHRVTCATSGHEAINLLSNGQPVDLVILDLMMPREDPTQTFQRVRQRRPAAPVLLCTGLPQAEVAPELLRQGAVFIIRKPFRMNELWYAVKQAIQASTPQEHPIQPG
jgi:two-component system cell cycle sensor histidine kinase/response regulator CckA